MADFSAPWLESDAVADSFGDRVFRGPQFTRSAAAVGTTLAYWPPSAPPRVVTISRPFAFPTPGRTITEANVSADLIANIRSAMALSVFGLGILSIVAGVWTILAREYQQTMRGIAAQSNRLHARSLAEVGVVPVLDASARLVESTTQLIKTAMGIGAFLCLIGLAMCLISFWMFYL